MRLLASWPQSVCADLPIRTPARAFSLLVSWGQLGLARLRPIRARRNGVPSWKRLRKISPFFLKKRRVRAFSPYTKAGAVQHRRLQL